jgi:hypothetical protein
VVGTMPQIPQEFGMTGQFVCRRHWPYRAEFRASIATRSTLSRPIAAAATCSFAQEGQKPRSTADIAGC